ncbi:MAG: YaiO family outer membrane beta-barrel protein [bacterium]|nr:YaiO family outer membrane beta-barrel protein [bacterium]
MRRAAAAFVAAAALCTTSVRAACPFAEQPAKSVQVEAGTSNDTLTHGRGTWSESALDVVARNGNQNSLYARIADDTRFGSSDPSYEAGAYSALDKHLIADLTASFSPTHAFLPATTESGGLDWRSNAGYGYQVQLAQRNYAAQVASIQTLGADRYVGADRFALGVTLARLTGVPGTALSERASFARYLGCDSETFSISAGRDVELTGVGSALAVYRAYSYDANDIHWFTKRFALDAGAGWYVLLGAYNRFEVRVALRERL